MIVLQCRRAVKTIVPRSSTTQRTIQRISIGAYINFISLQNSRLDNTPILAKPLLLHRKRNSKSGTPQTSTGSASKEGEFKFPEPLPPNRDSQWKPVRDVAETRSLSPEDAAQQLRNLKMDSISEGRRIGGPGPPTVLEVKSSVGVR